MQASFRKASIEDIDAIIDVQNRSFYDDFLKYGECPAYDETHEAIERQMKDAIVYVILWQGVIIGDIIISKRSEDSYFLRIICITPEYHSHGIGQKAIKFIERDNPEAKVWELVTPAESLRNHHFYQKMGYEKVNEYKHSDILTMFEYKKVIK